LDTKNGTCVKNCQKTEVFHDTLSNQCVQCSENCETCDKYGCLTCKKNFNLVESKNNNPISKDDAEQLDKPELKINRYVCEKH
jgi:hypothetical protein